MQKTNINLARRPFKNNTLHHVVFSTCFVFLLAATGYNIYDFFSAGSEIERLEQMLEERRRSYAELAISVQEMKKGIDRVDLASINTKSKFANGLIVSHLFSWSALFDRLEDLIPPDIKLRSIRPSISSDLIEIDIDGLARLHDALYEFEANLDESEYFSGVYPRSESTRESKNELSFRLRMDYLPAGEPDEESAIPPTPTAAMPQPEPVPEAEPEEGEAGAGEAAADSNLPVPEVEAAAPAGADEPAVTEPPAASRPPAAAVPQPPVVGAAKFKAGKAGKSAGRSKSGGDEDAAADPNGGDR